MFYTWSWSLGTSGRAEAINALPFSFVKKMCFYIIVGFLNRAMAHNNYIYMCVTIVYLVEVLFFYFAGLNSLERVTWRCLQCNLYIYRVCNLWDSIHMYNYVILSKLMFSLFRLNRNILVIWVYATPCLGELIFFWVAVSWGLVVLLWFQKCCECC